MRMVIAVLTAAALLVPVAAPVLALTNPDVEIALDCRAHDRTRACGQVYADCDEIQYQYDGTGDYDVLVVLYNFVQVTGVEYAIDYTGLADAEFISFTSCTDLYMSWSNPGLFDTWQVWSACKTPPAGPGSGLMVGWIRLLGAAGAIRIAPSITGERLDVVDCGFVSNPIVRSHDGFVGGALPDPGYIAPCGAATPTEETTWGGVKSLYR